MMGEGEGGGQQASLLHHPSRVRSPTCAKAMECAPRHGHAPRKQSQLHKIQT